MDETNNGDIITIMRRDDEPFGFTLKTIEDNLVDLTGGKAWFTVKATDEETETDAQALIAQEITSFTDPEDGVIYIDLSNEETDLEPGIYWYDLQFKDSRGKYMTKRGKLVVQQDITQDKV